MHARTGGRRADGPRLPAAAGAGRRIAAGRRPHRARRGRRARDTSWPTRTSCSPRAWRTIAWAGTTTRIAVMSGEAAKADTGAEPPPRRGHGAAPEGTEGRGPQDPGGGRRLLRLERGEGGQPRSLDRSRPPPRGRGADPAEPAGVPGGQVSAAGQRRAAGPAGGLPVPGPPRRRGRPATRRPSRPTRSWPRTCGRGSATAPPAPRPWPAAGAGRTGPSSSEQERARWRQQAREWLRLDLAAWTKRLETAQPADRAEVQKALARWREDPDLAGLRDADALEKLPPAERQECQALWQEVADLLRRAQTTRYSAARPPRTISTRTGFVSSRVQPSQPWAQ